MMENKYNPKKIEKKIQNHWDEKKTFHVKEDKKKEKYYCLSMLPYPSGQLHIGHVRNYTIGDVIARYQRMLGKNVLQPIGWDAFGLPAETAAIKHNIDPNNWTKDNIKKMKIQLKSLGFSYDWSREITTCNPEYYHWEQWFFLKLYEKGLVYKNKSYVNWCKNDQTVLANEQVINNHCWRCDSIVTRKKISQWFIKITNYADQLLNDLDKLEHWPSKVKTMQRNWIGRSEGFEIQFTICNNDKLYIYTNRLDTFMGVTYIAISINHPITKKLAIKNDKIYEFISKHEYQNIDTLKIKNEGIFSEIYAIHPLTYEKIPIWIVNFVSIYYSTDAVISVPAHNQIDYEFAIKYGIKLKPVILDENGKSPNLYKSAYLKKGIIFNSYEFNGLISDKASDAIAKKLYDKYICKYKVHYRLKDWNISRQRYWGTPIPIATIIENKKIVPISYNDLPVVLPPPIDKKIIKNDIYYSLIEDQNWKQMNINNQKAIRETDTFDTFMESSWYYARYTDPNYNKGMVKKDAANYWLPIDQYIGGIEHAIMHLLYFRFFHKLMRDIGLVNTDEPVKRLLCQGMVLSDAFYYINNNGERHWVSPIDVIIIRDNNGKIAKDKIKDKFGNKLIYAGMHKMSKSKNNGINPQKIIEQYGADTLRLFIMFAAPPEISLEWNNAGINGAYRFLNRIWNLVYNHVQKGPVKKLNINIINIKQKYIRSEVYKTINKVTKDIDERQSFNTAIAAIMELINHLYKYKEVSTDNEQDRAVLQEALLVVIRLLYPFTPHICFEMWKALGIKYDIDNAKWPFLNETVIMKNNNIIIIQINGKVRGKINFDTINEINEQTVYEKVCIEPTIFKYINSHRILKKIYIPYKLLNIVIE